MIADFISHAPAGTRETMQILATAESLTDEVESSLYELQPINGLDARSFLFALHQSAIVEPRNSEWSFPTSVRDHLRGLEAVSMPVLCRAHEDLLRIGRAAAPETAGRTVPSYLLTDAGKAYHSAYAGKVADALVLYDRIANDTFDLFNGSHWLASRFIDEQQRASVLPADATNLLFLRAMALHRDGLKAEAIPIFERIVARDEVSKFTAVACDIVGVTKRRNDRAAAEGLFRRAIEISREIGDRTGEGVHLHNYAQVIVHRRAEAEQAFRRSVEIAEETTDPYSAAIRKNGLADLLAHKGKLFRSEAERLLNEAIGFFDGVGDEDRAARPLTTLARLMAMDSHRTTEAEALYRRVIAVARSHGDRTGLSIRLSGLIKLLIKKGSSFDEVRTLLEENLELAREAGDRRLTAKLSLLMKRINY